MINTGVIFHFVKPFAAISSLYGRECPDLRIMLWFGAMGADFTGLTLPVKVNSKIQLTVDVNEVKTRPLMLSRCIWSYCGSDNRVARYMSLLDGSRRNPNCGGVIDGGA